MTAIAFGTLLPSVACDGPSQCTDDPSNLTPENTAACETLAVSVDPQIVNAGAEQLGDGRLVLTWTSRGLECGGRADNVEIGAPHRIRDVPRARQPCVEPAGDGEPPRRAPPMRYLM